MTKDNVYEGSAPDTGAYESGMTKWIAGAIETIYTLTIVPANGMVTPGSGSELPRGSTVNLKAVGNLGYTYPGSRYWTSV